MAELEVAMQLSGAANLAQLHGADLVVTGYTREWLTLRGFDEELKAMAQRRWRRMQAENSYQPSPMIEPSQV